MHFCISEFFMNFMKNSQFIYEVFSEVLSTFFCIIFHVELRTFNITLVFRNDELLLINYFYYPVQYDDASRSFVLCTKMQLFGKVAMEVLKKEKLDVLMTLHQSFVIKKQPIKVK